MKITVYTITDCKFSKEEKDYLKSLNLPFEEKNLEQNKDWLTEMLTVSNNFAGTPVTVIEKDDGSKVVLKGFTKEDFEKELKVQGPSAQATTSAEGSQAGTGQGAAAPTPVAAEPTPAAGMPPASPSVTPEPAMPSVPAAPVMPEPPMPSMPEPVSIPPAPTMPEPQVPTMPEPPAMADVPANVPDLSAAGMNPPAPPSAGQTSSMPPEPVSPMMPEPPMPAAPATSAPAPSVVPTGTPADSAATTPAPAVNDDALNAILNNLQAKVGDGQNPSAPTQ